MLAVIVFVLFWVLLALALVFIGVRGGLGGARAALQTQRRGGRKFFAISFVVIYVAFGIAIPLVLLIGNHKNANAKVGTVRLTATEKRGRVLFGQHCAVCHTLAGANAAGKVGPNLDQLKPPKTLVLNTILNGCVQNPPKGSAQACLGYGTMPQSVVQGQDAQAVAAFVAKVAGKE
ncbi:MAG TPA: c-type cytochrome [Solirubrobacteraceae bacterium]